MDSERRREDGAALVYFTWLMFAWCGAWLLFRWLEARTGYIASPEGQFVFWAAMKLSIWVLPALWLIRGTGRAFGDVMGFTRWRATLAWGLGGGAILALLSSLAKGSFVVPMPDPSWPLLNAVLVAPVVEEIAFRGAVLNALIRRHGFLLSNTLCAAMFLAAHVPGWWFQGRLFEMLTSPMSGAASIFALGWFFGFVVYRSRSVTAGVIAHGLNNLFA